MKVKELKEALRRAKKFVRKSSTLPILQCVRLSSDVEEINEF